MFNSRIKFEISTITCKKMQGTPLGIEVTYTVHLWLAGKRVVDFLLVLIEFFSQALMAATLISEICRNRYFPTGWVTLSANFR